MRSLVALPLLIAASLAALSARADENDDDTRETHRARVGSSAFLASRGPYVAAGADVTGSWDWAKAGLTFEEAASPGVFDGVGSQRTLGALAGITTGLDSIAIDVLATGGEHTYGGVGSELFGPTGASGSVPFVGARLGVAYVTSGRSRFLVGAWLFADGDLEKREVTYGYSDPSFFGPPRWQTAHATIGRSQAGVGLRVGFDVGI